MTVQTATKSKAQARAITTALKKIKKTCNLF